jgi:beta-lactamase class A
MLRLTALVVLLASPLAPGDDTLRTSIEGLIRESKAESVAVSFRDLASAEEIQIRPDETFHAASTMKLAVMAEVYRQAEAGTLTLDERIAIKTEFNSIADGSKYALDPEDDSELSLYKRKGERESIRELTRLMITESSNVATNLLIERTKAENASAFMAALGAPSLKILRGVEDTPAYRKGMNNTVSARGLMRFLSLLGDRAIISPGASDAMIEILLAQKFSEGIPAGLPKGTSVAHKTGWFKGVYHDAAIVMPAGRRPYVLVVLTRGIPDEKRAHRLVVDITRAVHAYATNQK